MNDLISQQGWIILSMLFIFSIWSLTKATDLLIDNAVIVSKKFGISELVIGATIVSIGTTLPELAASIVAVLQDSSGFAIGNATGSVITNLSLVLGVGALGGSMPVSKLVSKRLMFLSVISLLFIVSSIRSWGKDFFGTDGLVNQYTGFLFLILLALYLLASFKRTSVKETKGSLDHSDTELKNSNPTKHMVIIFVSALIVTLSAMLLVSTVETAAFRIGVSDAIISATIVSLGTSLPELSTTFASARKGLGGLAMGNIIGASIFNIVLVLGVSASLQPKGIVVPAEFFSIQFPLMTVIMIILLRFVYNSKKHEINKVEGIGLLLIYIFYLALNIF